MSAIGQTRLFVLPFLISSQSPTSTLCERGMTLAGDWYSDVDRLRSSQFEEQKSLTHACNSLAGARASGLLAVIFDRKKNRRRNTEQRDSAPLIDVAIVTVVTSFVTDEARGISVRLANNTNVVTGVLELFEKNLEDLSSETFYRKYISSLNMRVMTCLSLPTRLLIIATNKVVNVAKLTSFNSCVCQFFFFLLKKLGFEGSHDLACVFRSEGDFMPISTKLWLECPAERSV